MRALALASLLAALGCGGEVAPASSHDAGPICPAKAASCPEGCYPINGQPIDHVAHCVGPGRTIACVPPGGTGGIGISGCARDGPDGTKYLVPSKTNVDRLVTTGEWVECAYAVADTQNPCP